MTQQHLRSTEQISGDVLIFQLVDGTTLYDLDLSFAGMNSFTANGQLPVIAASAKLKLFCFRSDRDSDSSSNLLDLPQQFSGNTGSNMKFFTSVQLMLFQYHLMMHTCAFLPMD
ncbi:MAG: hypothetical protein CM15mP107_3920 [Bacteroidota bacterium]|nr:MAG: hypothetical protein CM15mP107_3920 [Bacteroidota bacterium]